MLHYTRAETGRGDEVDAKRGKRKEGVYGDRGRDLSEKNVREFESKNQ